MKNPKFGLKLGESQIFTFIMLKKMNADLDVLLVLHHLKVGVIHVQ